MEINAMVPELLCSDFEASLVFYTGLLGFSIDLRQDTARHAYLRLGESQIMLVQAAGEWETGPLERPYGRGINFQIRAADVRALHARVVAAGHPIFLPLEEQWYYRGARQDRHCQFMVQDPDGYLLRFFEKTGTRRLG